MKSAFSRALIVCLVALALPVTAQEQTQTSVSVDLSSRASVATAGPLARAVTREATQLAGAGEATGDDTVQQGGNRPPPGLVDRASPRTTSGLLSPQAATSSASSPQADRPNPATTSLGDFAAVGEARRR